MEYNNIISLVPQGEHFDASAINEGVWVSQAHLDAIENTLAGNAASIATGKEEFDALNGSTAQLKTDLEASAKTIDALNSTIADKDAEIERLKAAAAGQMKQTSKENDKLDDGAVAESDVTKEARRLREIRDGKKN